MRCFRGSFASRSVQLEAQNKTRHRGEMERRLPARGRRPKRNGPHHDAWGRWKGRSRRSRPEGGGGAFGARTSRPGRDRRRGPSPPVPRSQASGRSLRPRAARWGARKKNAPGRTPRTSTVVLASPRVPRRPPPRRRSQSRVAACELGLSARPARSRPRGSASVPPPPPPPLPRARKTDLDARRSDCRWFWTKSKIALQVASGSNRVPNDPKNGVSCRARVFPQKWNPYTPATNWVCRGRRQQLTSKHTLFGALSARSKLSM